LTGQVTDIFLADDGYMYIVESLPGEETGDPLASRALIGTATLEGDLLQADVAWLENIAAQAGASGLATVTIVFSSNTSLSGTIDYDDGSSTSFELERSEELEASGVDARLAGVWDGGAFNPPAASFLGNPYPLGLEFGENGQLISGVLNETCVVEMTVTPLYESPSESSSIGKTVLHRVNVIVSECDLAAEYLGSAVVIELSFSPNFILAMLWFNEAEQLQYAALRPQT
jgi:hypothetical protein